jgi:hypothetical protein
MASSRGRSSRGRTSGPPCIYYVDVMNIKCICYVYTMNINCILIFILCSGQRNNERTVSGKAFAWRLLGMMPAISKAATSEQREQHCAMEEQHTRASSAMKELAHAPSTSISPTPLLWYAIFGPRALVASKEQCAAIALNIPRACQRGVVRGNRTAPSASPHYSL